MMTNLDELPAGILDFRIRLDERLDLPPRDRILLATYETILEDQISGTRLRKIARKAGIAPGHLHYYFSSKDELLLEVLLKLIQFFSLERKTLLEDQSLSAKSKLLALFDIKMDGIKGESQDYVLFDFWVQSAGNESIMKHIGTFYGPWRAAIREIIQEGVEKGEFSARYANVMPDMLISILDGAALQYLIDKEKFDLEGYFRTARKMILELLEG